MKLFKLFMFVFSCIFVFTPTISFAKMNDGDVSQFNRILDENSQRIYQMSMKDFIKTQLYNISDSLNKIDFRNLGFSSDVSSSIDNNKPAFMQMLKEFAQPALDQVSEIDSQFNSAGSYFDYALNQLQNIKIDENAVKNYFKTADTSKLTALFQKAANELQDNSKVAMAKKIVEEYTAKNPQQLLGGLVGGNLLSKIINPVDMLKNLFKIQGMTPVDWVIVIAAGLVSLVIVTIGSAILGVITFILASLYSVVTFIIGFPILVITLILGVLNWAFTALLGVFSGLSVGTVVASILSVVLIPLTIISGITSAMFTAINAISVAVNSTLLISVPIILIGICEFIFAPLVGAVGGLIGAALVKTLVSTLKGDEEEKEQQPIQTPMPYYGGVPGYGYGGYGSVGGQQSTQTPTYGYGSYGY